MKLKNEEENLATKVKTPLLDTTRLFKGQADNPLLAPRGVWLSGESLLVSDTGQNRVFIWDSLPQNEFQPPKVVLGQIEKGATGRNSGGKVNASTLMYPSGIWSDGKRLIVADAWNHRVLVWLNFPERDGQPADVVIGQPDFASNVPNVLGVGKSPTAQSLYWPYGVYSDGQQLWIADTGNRRVLYFKEIPTRNYTAADGVIGKDNFEERDYENEDAIWPYSVKIGPKGELAITDTQYYRVLLWNDWQTAFQEKADTIIGQASFEGNGQNQFGWFPDANTLNWCYDTCFYEEGIWVADTGNSRVLWFDRIPRASNARANQLIGQDDFKTGSENKNTIWSTEGSFYWPFSVCIQANTMVVADTGNHRIVINHLNF